MEVLLLSFVVFFSVHYLFNNLISNRRKKKLLNKKFNSHVELSTDEKQYFFLVRHGIYLSTSENDNGLIELGRQQAYAAAETIDHLISSLENSSSRIVFTQLIHSGYKRAYETGLITGQRLEQMHRLNESFENIYKYFKCWGEIHSIERFLERWKKIQRLFFSQKSSKHYLIFSHGNLLSCIINYLISNGNSWQFANRAPHCSVSVLVYKFGDIQPQLLFSPFEIYNQTLPITMNNLNPKKMNLKQILKHNTITDHDWTFIVNTIIPERVVGFHTDQIPLIHKFIPDNDNEARQILFIFQQYYSQLITHNENDSDDEDN